jgi:hypothetical protein
MINCVDFDDLYDNIAARSLTRLLAIKEQCPAFTCTLFTIPARISDETIFLYKQYPWIALAPHGWRHTRAECIPWSKDEALWKITAARDRGIDAPAFRAPQWLITGEIYDACAELNYTVCDHIEYRVDHPTCNVYTYNSPHGHAPKVLATHGHLTNCAVDNYINDVYDRGGLRFHPNSTFAYPWQVALIGGKDTHEPLDRKSVV